jgi:N-acetylglucosaminyl-diphospho-decaprenol L-rhamnosyltransferase
MIDIVVLNYNDSDTTMQFLTKVEPYKIVDRIVVVDNCSTDDSLIKFRKINSPKVSIIQTSHNGGYGAGNNFGIRYLYNHYHPEFILLSNPDVIVEESVIEDMVNFLCHHNDYAIVAPFMLDLHKNRQFNTAFRVPQVKEYILSMGVLYSKFVKPFYYKDIETDSSGFKQVGSVSGSMFLMRTDAMIKYGMFDENIFLYCEEVVLGIKMKRAKQNVGLLLDKSFIHNHSVSINKSYKSQVAKRKLLNKSKMYVISHYYKCNGFLLCVAHLLDKISLVETWLLSILKGNNE